MKQKTILATLALLVSFGVSRASETIVLQEYDRSFRTVLSLNPDVGPGDDVGINVEVGAAISTYKTSDIGIFVGHMDADNSDMTSIGLYIQDSFDWGLALKPTLGAKAGYAWTDKVNDDDPDSIIFGFSVGVLYPLNERFEIHGIADFLWSDQSVFADTGADDDKAKLFGVGVVYRY